MRLDLTSLALSAAVVLVACADPREDAAKARLEGWLRQAVAGEYADVTGATDPAQLEELAKKTNQDVATVKRRLEDSMRQGKRKMKTYSIGSATKLSATEYRFTVTETFLEEGKESAGVETFTVVERNSAWYVRLPGD
jgi:hypothetical protein